jgi:hypothetical protein
VGKWAYCCRRQATGGILDDLQREYGGGTYSLKYADANNGQFKGNKTIVIQGSPLPEVVPHHAADDRLDRIERMLLERNAPAVPPADPIDMFTRMVAVVATLVPKPDTEPKANHARDMLDMYIRGREEATRDAKQLQALAATTDNDGSALLSIGVPLVELAKQQMALTQAGAVGRPTAPNVPQNGEVPVAVGPWWAHMLRPYINDLYIRAKAGKNPRVYADAVLEDLSDDMMPRVAELVADPDFPAKFLTVFSAFNETVELQQWISEFISEVRDVLSGDDGGAVESDSLDPSREVSSG